MNLHYGCGLSYAKDWFNCDSSPTLRLQKLPLVGIIFRKYLPPHFPQEVHYGDIVSGLSIPPESCEAIYCSHVLEHLALEDFRLALRNTHCYLKPGGTFRLVVPDFERQVAYYRDCHKPTAVSDLMAVSGLGRKTRSKGIVQKLRQYFGNSHHLWAWDYKGLVLELEEAGFRGMRRCQYGDASVVSRK